MIALIKLLFMLVMVTVLDYRGIIYRGVKQKKDASYQGGITRVNPLILKKGKLTGTWRLVDYDFQNTEQVSAANGQDQLLISFFPDSSFTRIHNKGAYSFGRYSYDEQDQSLLLTTNRSTEEIRVISKTTPAGRQQLIFEFAPGQALSLAQYGEEMDKFREDPFSVANNAWRIRPDSTENRKQILERLINYVGHNASILRAGYIREQDYISWEFTKGIIKVYNVGIGIVPKNQVPQAWIDSFHSKEDAMTGYAIFENYLRNGKHTKHNSGNWLKDDYQILADIRDGLRSWQQNGIPD